MKKQPKQKIKVTFPNGDIVCKSSAINTTLEVLRRIGSDRFEEITLKQSGLPLVSQTIFTSHKKFTKEICDGWYYIHLGDTATQVLKLKAISEMLHLDLEVVSGTNFSFERTRSSNRQTRPKKTLYVEFNDGTVFNYNCYLDTFKGCIYKIGPDAILRANNVYVNGSAMLITVVPSQTEAFKVGANQYLTLPNGVKETYKLLKVLDSKFKTFKTIDLIDYGTVENLD